LHSKNIEEYIEKKICKLNPDNIVIFCKSEEVIHILNNLEEILNKQEKKQFFIFIQNPFIDDIEITKLGFIKKHTKIRSWSLKRYLKFLFKNNQLKIKLKRSLHDQDLYRLPKWKLKKLLISRQLLIMANKLFSFSNSFLLNLLILFPFILFSIFFLLFFKNLRSKIIDLEYQDHNKNRIFIMSFDGPEKDHYGESPLLLEDLDYFYQSISNKFIKNKCSAFYLDLCSPILIKKNTDLFLKRLITLKNDFYILNGWRQSDKEFLFEIENSSFIKGSNLSYTNTNIYSDHCIKIGALDHELWVNND
tara:strand:- start:476 stop:1390 length:915 start_codon:yes stop_codon:yes gene_type:complete